MIEIRRCVWSRRRHAVAGKRIGERAEAQLRHRIIIASTNVLYTFPCRIKSRRHEMFRETGETFISARRACARTHASAFPRIEFGPAKFESRKSTDSCFIAPSRILPLCRVQLTVRSILYLLLPAIINYCRKCNKRLPGDSSFVTSF